MRRALSIVLFVVFVTASFAQDTLCPSAVARRTKSYLIADCSPNDTSFLKEQGRQAGLDLGIAVLANRIPTDSKLVTPKPSEKLLKKGISALQLPIDDKQTEFAVYHSEFFNQPAYINVMQIGEELITYRTTEKVGDINLFYGCIRGAYGTRKSAHPKNSCVNIFLDTPQRTLLPDFELQNQMAQAEAMKLAKTDYPLLIFNDLKSYAHNRKGDTAIVHLLDTMRKYNPDKMLQADLLTPDSKQYLSRVNENQLWNESMRTKIVETLTERQTYYRQQQMPWMIGNFQIQLADKYKSATPMEELEWFLSKAAAFDAGFGLDYSLETMKQHGLHEAFIHTIRAWETLRLGNAFSHGQKERMKDPYGDWHVLQVDDTTYRLFEQQISRRYPMERSLYACDTCKHQGELIGNWIWKPAYSSPMILIVKVEGKGSIENLCLLTTYGKITFPCTVLAGQYLIYDPDRSDTALVTDANYNTVAEIKPTGFEPVLGMEETPITASCTLKSEGKKVPEVSIRYISRGTPETLILTQP